MPKRKIQAKPYGWTWYVELGKLAKETYHHSLASTDDAKWEAVAMIVADMVRQIPNDQLPPPSPPPTRSDDV